VKRSGASPSYKFVIITAPINYARS
jgi:hypothetical protein